MSAEPYDDTAPVDPSGCTCSNAPCPGAAAWREVARALFAACSFDEFDSLHEVHAGDMREAAELFRRLDARGTESS